MALALKDWDLCGRKYWGFDSFQGLPGTAEEDAEGSSLKGRAGLFAAGLSLVKANFKKRGVSDPSLVQLVPGWYNESLPRAEVQQIAFLRLDGDLFVSTWDALVNLYHKVAPNGFIYVDDYGSYNGCREAIDRFRLIHGISSPLHWIRESTKAVEAVWWQKVHHSYDGVFGAPV